MVIATNLTFVCFVCKEKIVKKILILKNERPDKFRKLHYSTGIVKKNYLIPNKSFMYSSIFFPDAFVSS